MQLNIFEEEYQLLMRNCFENNRPLGLVTEKEELSKERIGTLLYVTSYDEYREDGSSIVTLKAGYRFAMKDTQIEPNSFGLDTGKGQGDATLKLQLNFFC